MTGDSVLPTFAEVVDELIASPLGYVVDGDGKLWPPTTSHDQHRYEFNCAVCRAGDRPAALTAVVGQVLNLGAPRAAHIDSPNQGTPSETRERPA
jgi:hypothetical protein